TMPIESNQLRSQLADFFNEVSDQLSLRSLPGVGCSERIDPPALWLSACDQCADARDLVKRVLWEARAKCRAHLRVAGTSHVKQSRSCGKIGDRFKSQTRTDCSGIVLEVL